MDEKFKEQIDFMHAQIHYLTNAFGYSHRLASDIYEYAVMNVVHDLTDKHELIKEYATFINL